ncbi:Uncharacterized protein FKW44_009904, partial [Caligus rogercresseyi]
HFERQAIQQKIREEIQNQKEEHLTVYKKNTLDVETGSDLKSISMEIGTARVNEADEGDDHDAIKRTSADP